MAKQIDISIPISTIWKPENAGDSVRGFYRDQTTFQNSKYEKPVYLIGFKDGKCCAVNGDAVVKRAFDRIPVGAFVQITFEGMKNGDKYQYRSYDVKAWQIEDSEVEKFNAKVSIPLDNEGDLGQSSKASEENSINDKDDDLPF